MMKKTAIVLTVLLASAATQATELIGRVQALNKQSIVSEVGGVIERADLEIGDSVDKNQPIAKIKAQDFQFRVSKTKANLTLAEADFALRKATFMRYQELIKRNSLSAGDLDSARAAFLSAQASIDAAKIEYQQSKEDLSDTQITSQLSGYISQKPIQIGAWVNEGELLYEVVNIDKVTISLMASEYDLQHFIVGQKIAVWSEAEPETKIAAKIQRIGVQMQDNSQTYPIFAEVSNTDFRLRPGMSVYASTDLTLINKSTTLTSPSKNREQ